MIDSTKARLAVGIVGTAPAGIAMASALAGAGHLLIGITHTSPADADRVDAALPGLDALEFAGDIIGGGFVILGNGHVEQLARIDNRRGNFRQRTDDVVELRTFLAECLGAVRIVPDAGVFEFLADFFEALTLAIEVKDTPGAK